MYYVLLLQKWHHVMILVRTNHPRLRVRHHRSTQRRRHLSSVCLTPVPSHPRVRHRWPPRPTTQCWRPSFDGRVTAPPPHSDIARSSSTTLPHADLAPPLHSVTVPDSSSPPPPRCLCPRCRLPSFGQRAPTPPPCPPWCHGHLLDRLHAATGSTSSPPRCQ
jgi:hypothetical protein